jgi:ADP-ribosylglycohydrolase
VDRALALAGAGPATTGAVQALGEGWVAEEALAISLYCALAAPDLESALLLAVNHGGDSDSTGAITGNLLGAIHGERAIPRRWLEALELRAEIERVAEELHAACGR